MNIEKVDARQERHGPLDTREKIIQAAREEFALHGLKAARIAPLCRRAGVANGTFYLYFKTKEQIWEELLNRAVDELAFRLLQSRAMETVDARTRDRMDVAIIVEFAEQRRETFGIFLGERSGSAEPSGQVNAHNLFFERLNRQRSEMIADGIARGEFRQDLDPMLAAMADYGMTAQIIEWWLVNRDAIAKETLIARLAEMRARILFPD